MATWQQLVAAVRNVAATVSIGGDLTQVSLPAIFCFPHSTVEMIPQKRMLGQSILPKITKDKTDIQRMLYVVSWMLAADFIEKEFGKKPLNAVLGETSICKSGNMVYIGEQVSHHPPTTAYHFEHESRRIFFDGTATVAAQFFGNSVGVEISGSARLMVDLNGSTVEKPKFVALGLSPDVHSDEDSPPPNMEEYTFAPPLPKGYARGLLVGSKYYEVGGTTSIACAATGLTCTIDFKLSSMFSSTRNRLSGNVSKTGTNDVLASFSGSWDALVVAISSHDAIQSEIDSEFPNGVILDRSNVPACSLVPLEAFDQNPDYYTSESVWGEVTRAISSGNYEKADKEKKAVEKKHRKCAAELKASGVPHTPRYFEQSDALAYQFTSL